MELRYLLRVCIFAVFLSCSGCLNSIVDPAESQLDAIQTLNQARHLWENRPFSDYEYTLIYYTPGGPCEDVTIVVRDGVIADFERGCQIQQVEITTIDGIFNTMYQILTQFECGPNGCACDGFITFEAEFNDQYGYPTLWNYDVTGNDSRPPNVICTEIGIGYADYYTDTITITSFIILPDDE